MSKHLTLEEKEQIIYLYTNELKTMQEIANLFNKRRETISRILNTSGISGHRNTAVKSTTIQAVLPEVNTIITQESNKNIIK